MRIAAVVEPSQQSQAQKYVLLFGVLLLFTAVVIGGYVLSRSLASRGKPPTDADRERKLDDLLLEGRISEKTYERLRKKYAAGAETPKPPRPRKK